MREWSCWVFLQTSLRQLQQELADCLKKLSMCEASLEVNTRYRNDLEEEKARTLKDMDRLKGKVPINLLILPENCPVSLWETFYSTICM